MAILERIYLGARVGHEWGKLLIVGVYSCWSGAIFREWTVLGSNQIRAFYATLKSLKK
jgi:hypothetical protein